MKGRNDRFTISIYLLPLFLAVFLTACEVGDSYMNAEVISADETSITVRSIKAGDPMPPGACWRQRPRSLTDRL